MNIKKISGLDKTALLLSRVVRCGRLGKTIRNLRFKYIVHKHDKYMYHYNFCSTRKTGVTDLMVYRVAMRFWRKGLHEEMKYKIGLLDLLDKPD